MKNKIGSSRAKSRDLDSSTAVGMTHTNNVNFKQVIVTFFFVAILGLGIWYAKNRQAQNIVSGVVSSPIDVLKNTIGVTNVLLLGIGGEGHEGSDLTDTMLLVSFNLMSNKLSLISLPRDIWLPSLKAKINTAYHYGGLDLAKSSVSEIIGIPVHYAVTIDFQGFVRAIDAVGGIDVEVDRTFDDYEYPIPGMENTEPVTARYEHLHFDVGKTHMNGTMALKFARSRHAIGEEGTDFARGIRQQKVVFAFRNKLFNTGTIFSFSKIDGLKASIFSSLNLDITPSEQGSLIKSLLNLGSTSNITSLTLTNYFMTPKNTYPYAGQWVLIPKTSWEEIHAYIAKELNSQ